MFERDYIMGKEDRGFASMNRDRQREIASKGGKAAHQQGTAHEWDSYEASEAGRKGGIASARARAARRAGITPATVVDVPVTTDPVGELANS